MLTIFLALLLAACGNVDPAADEQGFLELTTRLLLVDPDSSALTALDGRVVAGTISLRLEDDQGVEQADYLVNLSAGTELTDELLDGVITPAGHDSSLAFVFDTTSLHNGTHTLTIVSENRHGKLYAVAHSRFHVSNQSGSSPPDGHWSPRAPLPADPIAPPVTEKPDSPIVDPPTTDAPVPDPVKPPAPDSSGHWKPGPGLTWYWQLTGPVDMNREVDVYDIDYLNSASTVAALHAQGKKVIAYVPVGDWESYRPDSNDFPQEALCGAIAGWPERYIDIRHPKAVELIKARIALAAQSGFDGIEGDVVDLHYANTGCRTKITGADMTAYLKDLTDYAHSLGLVYFAKNVSEDAAEWSKFTDGVVVEQAYQWNEQAGYMPYINAGKPVFAVEYDSAKMPTAACNDANSRKYGLYLTDLALTGKVLRTCW